ncbi:MupA/Atu3671 family FMN-dependent luciferase-like monooxygenase [Saccharopolyspora sp. NPDC050389]|uniref:MupA/Atu3671 family FMN-dependent luciferase-like monooxygenase n=1 Tax=Saccharopolyspora sp. NPDC050389 TaxID=3155516 RepID=UPI0033F11A55
MVGVRDGTASDRTADPTPSTIHRAVEDQVLRSPDAVAIAHRWSELSYAALNARANQLAHHLRALGTGPGCLVGVSLRRGPDLVVALLAVLKAGGAFVPLDPAEPAKRLALIAADSDLHCLITSGAGAAELPARHLVRIDAREAKIAQRPTTPPESDVDGEHPAYVTYTSGPHGRPLGIVVRHRNALSRFAGMRDRIGCTESDVVLALTGISFDAAVLELLWPLTGGAKVVVAGDRLIENLAPAAAPPARPLGFSLFFFAAATADEQRRDGYRLVLEAAKFGDAHGFEAVWTPERHFHSFGGLYPNPAVMAAALATVTDRIGLRCGSVVAPLHDTVRIAEEWSLVDNLSNGRVGLAFASGWNTNDFVFFPDDFPRRKQRMAEQLDEFRRLWRGEPVRRRGGDGQQVDVRVFPSPVQDEPQIWLTSAGSVETFERAGAAGVNVLTHLLGQDLDELAVKIEAYRRARADCGFAGPGRVSVMVHTFLLDDAERAKAQARGPFREYLRSSAELSRVLFGSGAAVNDEDLESVLDLALDRYLERSGLFGSPAEGAEVVRRLEAAGADEIACLIDFGVAVDEVIAGLPTLNRLKELHEEEVADAEHSFAQLCRRYNVTLLQCTPSFLSALVAQSTALESLRGARALLVGGEAIPADLARRLSAALPGVRLFAAYGSPESTFSAAVHEVAPGAAASIGRPLPDTEVLVVDEDLREVPVGAVGELLIGGAGIAAGYLDQPGLTAQWFVASRSGTAYRTGDRVRREADGTLGLQARDDRRVTVLGHLVEPAEVEDVLSRHAQVESVEVTASTGRSDGAELVARVTPVAQPSGHVAEEAHVRRWGQEWERIYAAADPGIGSVEPIPPQEMREWLDHTAGRIADLAPRSVVDVGAGPGLLLRALLPHIKEYRGFEPSSTAIGAARQSLGPAPPRNVVIDQADAAALTDMPTGSADVVVLNSVVQYFPSTGYLERVLAEAARVGRHAVFVGDVRGLAELDACYAAAELKSCPPLASAAEIAAAIWRGVAGEPELCLSPAYFRRLDAVGEARVELKRGHAVNELTCFRYDVTLLLDEPPGGPAFDAVAWSALPAGLDGLGRRIGIDPLTVTGIPNRRLVRPRALLQLLGEAADDTTAWELERLLCEVDESSAVDPESVVEFGERHGARVRLLVPEHGGLDEFDAVFEPVERRS